MRTRHGNARTDCSHSAGHDGEHDDDDDGGRGGESDQDAGRSYVKDCSEYQHWRRGTTGNGGFGPSGKIFRDIRKFSGEEGAWAEWALKFRITIKEYDVGLFPALEMAGDSEAEINMIEVAQSNVMDRCMEKSAMLYNRFVHLLSGPALTLLQSVVGENGLKSGDS